MHRTKGQKGSEEWGNSPHPPYPSFYMHVSDWLSMGLQFGQQPPLPDVHDTNKPIVSRRGHVPLIVGGAEGHDERACRVQRGRLFARARVPYIDRPTLTPRGHRGVIHISCRPCLHRPIIVSTTVHIMVNVSWIARQLCQVPGGDIAKETWPGDGYRMDNDS